MTDKQYEVHCWMKRMDDLLEEIESWETKREKVLASMGGVANYDLEAFKSGSGNSAEAKYIEFAWLSEIIEEKQNRLSLENVRTEKVINMIEDTPEGRKFKTILVDKYINRLKPDKLREKFNYEKSAMSEWTNKALDAVAPFIPKECLL